MVHSSVLGAVLAAVAGQALAFPALVSPRANTTCPVVFDGRVATGTQLTAFDSASTSPFNADYVKGAGLKWSDILVYPAGNLTASKFDGGAASRAVEVTLSDKSIFNNQNGFRRAGLLFAKDTNTGSPGSTGVKTMHFSVHLDSARKLNTSHEYLLVWHEAADYSANQFNFQAGKILGQNGKADTFKVLNRQNSLVWETAMDYTSWHNFAITLDFSKNTLQVYYSKGDAELAAVTQAVSNNNAGDGQYQIGVLKKPTGSSDVVNSGFQQKNLNEGVIYGGVFLEDSAGGCLSK